MKGSIISNLPLLVLVIFGLPIFVCSQHYSVTNIAGDGSNIFVAGQEATNTGFQAPAAMAMDSEGNIHFTVAAVLAGQPGIFKIDNTTGILSLVHDPGKGLNGMAIDSEDRIYFTRSSAVPEPGVYLMRLNPDGVIDTIAGNGVFGTPVDGADARSTPLGSAAGVKVGPNEEYVYYSGFGETSNYIQRVNLTTGVTERFAGNGGPDPADDVPDGSPSNSDINVGLGLAWDDANNLYFGTKTSQIKMIRASDNTIWSVAGTGVQGYGGDGVEATTTPLFIAESGFLINDNNEMILCDTYNHRIRKIDLETNIITTIVGSGFEPGSADNPDGELLNGDFKMLLEPNIRPSDVVLTDDGMIFSDIESRIRKTFLCTNPVISAPVIDNDEICVGDSVTMSFNGELNDAVFWEWHIGSCDGEVVADAAGASLTVMVTEATTYYAIGAGGCVVADCQEFNLALDCQAYFNTFTPNGDGINDYLEIPILANYPKNFVVIYNRWGDVIQEFNDYDNAGVTWTGTDGLGGVVNSGTYFFTATSNGNVIVSGWIEVIK